MPCMEFVCRRAHRTEKIMTFAEAEATEHIYCPACFAEQRRRIATRVISAPAVLFKGEGWTPTFHTPGQSHISGIPVDNHSDPVQVAKDVVKASGGGKNLMKAVQGAK